MAGRPFKLLVSVKAKLFAGFLAMAVLIAGLGGYSLQSIGSAGDVVTDTFDRPLMAVNFARSASQTFTALELESLRPSDPNEPEAHFDWLSEKFTEDLAIARERSIAPKADAYFEDVTTDFAKWRAAERALIGTSWRESNENDLSLSIEENLDIIVELQTNESFRNREAAIATMARIRQLSGVAVAAAIVLTLALTAWITVTIVRPLKAAANAASQISAGELDVEIPRGGDDETGTLLRSMSAMQSNIRSRMEAEQDLRTLAQHRLSDSLENSKDAVLLTDVDGRITVANPGVAHMFPELLRANDCNSFVGLDCGDIFGADGIPLQTRIEGSEADNEFRSAAGRWVRVNASATREGGRLFIWSDISESKAQEERLRQARDAAEAASRAKTLFLAAMSHEMNTPLNAIIGLSDVMKMQLAPTGDGRGDDGLANMAGLISQSGSQMAQIVGDVLEIANDDTETIGPDDLELADLSGAVEKALQGLRESAECAGIRLLWTPPQDPIYILGEFADLQQLATKLIDNAIKFNQAGGAVKAQLSTPGDEHVRFDIIDNGIGIAPDDLDRIFAPFVQVDEGYTRAVDGTGLGLCVAERICKRHGAVLSVKSTPGKGSVFSVLFPRRAATNSAASRPSGSDDSRHETFKRNAA